LGQGKEKIETEKLRMPNLHLTRNSSRAYHFSIGAARKIRFPPTISIRHWIIARTFNEGWWIVKKYKLYGLPPDHSRPETSLMAMPAIRMPQVATASQAASPKARASIRMAAAFPENPSLNDKTKWLNGVRS